MFTIQEDGIMNKSNNPAPKGNQFARKLADKLNNQRMMVNITITDRRQIELHLSEIGMTWAQWSRAVIRQAIAEETTTTTK
jgi:hypothetical protein